MKCRIFILILVTAASFLSSCLIKEGNAEEDEQAAEYATGRFHVFYNDKKYEEIYGLTHEMLRHIVPHETFIEGMGSTREAFGRMIEVKDHDTHFVLGAPGGPQVRIGLHTKFENGDGTEIFTWFTSGKVPELALYKLFHGTLPFDQASSSTPPRQ